MEEQHAMIYETVRRFSREVLAPGAARREHEKAIEPEVIQGLAELGLLGMTVSPDYDGAGADYVGYALALMAVAEGDGAVSTMMSVHNAPFCAILERYGSPAQKEDVLKPAARGEFIGAFALTESHAGSDAAAIRTRARRDGAHYVIDGEKQFITSGKIGAYAVVFAVTDPPRGKQGISAFLVPTDTPGYHVSKIEQKAGQKASDTCSLSFDGMRLPVLALIGEEGEGYRIALSSLEAGRIGIAAQSVGMAQAALDAAIIYAQERSSFGKSLFAHQAVAFRLADARARLEAARQLVLSAARLKDAGTPALQQACMAKLVASETAEQVCSAALQTFGGYGYVEDFPVERIWRDARVCQIYEGTSDIQKIILARGLQQ
ncbi:TPA: acyl-CoA dehydrogenase family protein [Escherichia coli]|uniref:acyl-CoA dehydrogenase family protein n=1 Tax=Pseudomonadota TaxID=1224 RepID=UPI00287CB455|nr:acyl-CoA dehydrogenase family protein [Escherichia coli]HEA1240616.1 acyl-CoA dehydrogenase family protein [Escherichia coli]HEA1932963.1 acyl-CoA dehydrogenase family protein [Escherichia coli]HEA2340384.1 acyl-CoA dehydrogenase family protein [Escherichia coli]